MTERWKGYGSSARRPTNQPGKNWNECISLASISFLFFSLFRTVINTSTLAQYSQSSAVLYPLDEILSNIGTRISLKRQTVWNGRSCGTLVRFNVDAGFFKIYFDGAFRFYMLPAYMVYLHCGRFRCTFFVLYFESFPWKRCRLLFRDPPASILITKSTDVLMEAPNTAITLSTSHSLIHSLLPLAASLLHFSSRRFQFYYSSFFHCIVLWFCLLFIHSFISSTYFFFRCRLRRQTRRLCVVRVWACAWTIENMVCSTARIGISMCLFSKLVMTYW